MAGLTKAQREAKVAKLAEEVNKETNPGITVINVAADNEVLKKLNLQEQEETAKLKKSMLSVEASIPTNIKPAPNGMVNYFDTVTGRHGTEKESIFRNMEKFNPKKYKRI